MSYLVFYMHFFWESSYFLAISHNLANNFKGYTLYAVTFENFRPFEPVAYLIDLMIALMTLFVSK